MQQKPYPLSSLRDGILAVILSDWEGKLVDGMVNQLQFLQVFEVCLMVRALGLKGVEVEPDNKQAFLLCVSELVPPWEVDALVWDIQKLDQWGDLSVRWVRWSANKAAHEVAA